MIRICRQCRRPNPRDAVYCHHDGILLDGASGGSSAAIDVGALPFHLPFILPSGRACRSFNELALACHADPATAHDLLRTGHLETFLAGQGRADLARAAHDAARAADRERGLDDFLGQLPATVLPPPQLHVEPTLLDLGTVRPGEDRRCELVLRNGGQRLLSGSASIDKHAWLSLGDGPPQQRKLFQLSDRTVLPVRVLGANVRTYRKPQEAAIHLESNGGKATVTVRLWAPVQPFPEGALSGALSPRELASKAHDAPKEAAVLIENGAVARWYRANGWDYPVLGPAASGAAAVQQFFEALGLVKTPQVELSEEVIQLRGQPGAKIEYSLAVITHEHRAAIAHGTSDQPWLQVGRTIFRGRSAFLPLTVAAVPGRKGDNLQAVLSVTANGNQRFAVPVFLAVGGVVSAPRPPRQLAIGPVSLAAVSQPTAAHTAAAPMAVPPVSRTPAGTPPAPPPSHTGGRRWLTVAIALLLALTVLGAGLRDYFAPGLFAPRPPVRPPDTTPYLLLRFHDEKQDDKLEKIYLADTEPTMRFGLTMLYKGAAVGTGVIVRRLTFDPWGRTNNTCLRLDKTDERLFGTGGKGHWEERAAKSWTDDQGQEHSGVRSVWLWDDKKVQVTQSVELVRGEQTNLLDTCRVGYLIENHDTKEHEVGIRFLLDTFIGGNDGVPFTIPGDSALCDTLKDLKDQQIPDFLQALENADLAKPGTVAHLRLKLPNRETPVRVTLGAWPNDKLRIDALNALGPNTLWDVPLLSMKEVNLNDSAVVIYWKEEALQPAAKREVGFDYGLWSLDSKSDRLAATVDGLFRPAGELTVVAYVNQGGQENAEETLTLTLPEGFTLAEGKATQSIPPLPKGVTSGNRPVTWKVKAGAVGKYEFTVKSSAGVSQTIPVTIRQREIFD